MRYSYLSLVIVTVFLALSLSACTTWPSQTFQLAEKAKGEAAAVQADQFAPDLWVSAEKAWQEGNARAEAKKYGEADKFFLKAKGDFVKARDSAKSRRDDMIKNINNYLVTIEKRLKTDLLDNAAANNLPPARKKEFDAKVKEISDSRDKIRAQLDGGQILEANVAKDKTVRAIWDVQQEYLKK